MPTPDETGPEVELLQAVKSTRQVMLASANLATSELGKRYPNKVYRHHQDRGEPKAVPRLRLTADSESIHTGELIVDDFQSPTQPTKYIALRIEPAITFYQKRIPKYARRAAMLKLLVVLCGVAASVLARAFSVRSCCRWDGARSKAGTAGKAARCFSSAARWKAALSSVRLYAAGVALC